MPIPVYTANVPRINIPTGVSSAPAQADAQMWKSVGNFMGQVNEVATEFHKQNVVAQSKAAGIKFAEGGGNVSQTPESNATLADKAFRESAIETYTAELTFESAKAISDLGKEFGNNIPALEKNLNAYVDGLSAELPDEIRSQVKSSLSIKAMGEFEQRKRAYQSAVEEQNKIRMQTMYEQSRFDLENAPLPQTEAEDKAYTQKITEFTALNNNLIAKGVISPAAGMKNIEDLNKAYGSKLVASYIGSLPEGSSLAAAMEGVMKGKTGNPKIDNIPENMRQSLAVSAFSREQMFAGAMRNEEERIEKQAKLAREEAFAENYRTLLLSGDRSPEAKSKALALADSPVEFDRIEKLFSSKQSDVSDIATERDVAMALRKGTLTQDILDNAASEGKLSVNDYNKYSNYLASIPKSLANSVAMQGLKTWLNNEYPTKYIEDELGRKKNAKQVEENLVIVNALIDSITQRIATGEIKTEAQLLDVINQEKAKRISTVSSKPNILPPTEQQKNAIVITNENNNLSITKARIISAIEQNPENAKTIVRQALSGLDTADAMAVYNALIAEGVKF